MFSQDRLSTDHATAVENEMMYYGDQNNLQNSAGATWRHLWGAAGVSHLTLSHTLMRFTETFRDIASQEILFANRSNEQSMDLRNTNRFALGRSASIECGVDLRREVSAYDNRFGATTDQLGTPTPEVRILRDLSTTTAGVFASLSVEPMKDLTATAGVRVDHFRLFAAGHGSPRVWRSCTGAPISPR